MRPQLDHLEADENDADRLERLYKVDHAIAQMRRAARDLRILAGSGDTELGGHTSSLLDVIRMAESSIEHYTQVSITTVAELAVVAYVADDVASLLAALLDNATSYSPSTVTVSAHLLEDGAVMFRIEDAGIGIARDQVAALNAALAGRVPEVRRQTGRHTGFPVVHRLASKHGIRVRLACRTSRDAGASGGTLAMVIVPPQLICEIPATSGEDEAVSFAAVQRPVPPVIPGPPTRPPEDSPATMATVNGLPLRSRTSLRGVDTGAREDPDRDGTPDSAAARRSFAEDLSAFAAGGQDARGERPPKSDDDLNEGP